MNRLIISAPFGNYLQFPYATSTIGTYTLYKRAGTIKRWWKVLSTVRPWLRTGSWVNKLGLPNPGIWSLRGLDLSGCILSVYGFDTYEWMELARLIKEPIFAKPPLAVEANLGCPNVTSKAILELVTGADYLQECNLPVIAKIPPLSTMDFVKELYKRGILNFHLCNTIPTLAGGISGKVLKPFSLQAVRETRDLYSDKVRVIGGGGITGWQDASDYLDAGADHVSVASLLFNPFSWWWPFGDTTLKIISKGLYERFSWESYNLSLQGS